MKLFQILQQKEFGKGMNSIYNFAIWIDKETWEIFIDQLWRTNTILNQIKEVPENFKRKILMKSLKT